MNIQQIVKSYQLMLFGKDVYSIINSYNPEGFDGWLNHVKNINKEYHEKLVWEEVNSIGRIISKKSATDCAYDKLFQTRLPKFNTSVLIWHTDLRKDIPKSEATIFYTKNY